MKRISSLILTLLFVGIMTGCGETTKAPEEIAINSMYNEATKQTISLDMDRETIEEQLGEGTEQVPVFIGLDEATVPPVVISSSQYISYGTDEDFLVVCYEGNTPISISSCGNFPDVVPDPSNWSIKHGLSYGSSMADIVANYGEGDTTPVAPTRESAIEGEGFLVTPNVSWKSPFVVSYYYDKDYNRLDNVTDEKVMYKLSFIVDEEQDGLMWYTVSYGVNVPEAGQ